MMCANILIVEDESIVAMEIEEYLLNEGYSIVAVCSNAKDAYETAINNQVDLILMDISLMDSSNGIEAGKQIKKVKENIPIIFLTSFMDEYTIDKAIEIDPVAYLSKPFNQQELLASIKIALRHRGVSKDVEHTTIKIDDEFSFYVMNSELICNGELVRLNKKERTLLQLFIERANQLISNESIEYTVWPDTVSNDNARRILINRLRKKLKHKFIDTLGYSSPFTDIEWMWWRWR